MASAITATLSPALPNDKLFTLIVKVGWSFRQGDSGGFRLVIVAVPDFDLIARIFTFQKIEEGLHRFDFLAVEGQQYGAFGDAGLSCRRLIQKTEHSDTFLVVRVAHHDAEVCARILFERVLWRVLTGVRLVTECARFAQRFRRKGRTLSL